MINPIQPSPMLAAIDLMRLDVDAMSLDDLEAHAQHVLDTLAGLNDYINSPGFKSADGLRNALRQAKKLILHMARVRDLIQAHKLAAVVAANAQAASAASLSPPSPSP
jgi:hypothetical protein